MSIDIIKIGFHTPQLCERGTTVALFDYAYYNQLYYNNKSIIFYERNNPRNNIEVVKKFEKYFQCYPIENFNEINKIIEENNITYFYSIVSGEKVKRQVTDKCKFLVHSVFNVEPYGDVYATVSEYLAKKSNYIVDYVPHMINLPLETDNLRVNLSIPENSIVIGRYGGFHDFNIYIVFEAIRDILNIDPNIYFIFANTFQFYHHPRIIYLETITNPNEKVKFINTCDAMIHARLCGESFGLSIAEFSSLNKPVITCLSNEHNAHIEMLGEKGIYYDSRESLLEIFRNIRTIIKFKSDWNAYRNFKPEKVMKKFMKTFGIEYNPSYKKVGYIGFPEDFQIENDSLFIREFKNKNFIVEKDEQNIELYDVIVMGSDIKYKDYLLIQRLENKCIYNLIDNSSN